MKTEIIEFIEQYSHQGCESHALCARTISSEFSNDLQMFLLGKNAGTQ